MKPFWFVLLAALSLQHAQGDTAIGKTITRIPYTISKPGKYRFAKDLTLTTGTATAISITASNVVLDLNGYTLAATGLANIATNLGIDVQDADHVTIRNGTIVGFGMAINCLNQGMGRADALLVEDMTCDSQVDTDGLSAAMNLLGKYSAVRRCRVINTAGGESVPIGIATLFASVIEDCTVSDLRSFGSTRMIGYSLGNGPGDGNYSCVVRRSTVSNLTSGGGRYGVVSAAANGVADGCTFYSLTIPGNTGGSGLLIIKNSSFRACGTAPFTTFSTVKDGGNNTNIP